VAYRDEDGDVAAEAMRKRMHRETRAHLADIRREHGAGKHWATMILPSGAPHFINAPPLYSSFGSPGALCAAIGESTPRPIGFSH
jgi:hypothetical protein